MKHSIDERLAERLVDRFAQKLADALSQRPLYVVDVTPKLDGDIHADEPEDDGLTEAQREQIARREAAMR